MQITNSNFLFQFHEGPIKTKHSVTLCLTFTRFNSMKVRLKLSSLQSGLCDYMFQFHEGPIKTKGPSYYLLPKNSFNSMKVRLKLQQASDVNDFANVSIP